MGPYLKRYNNFVNIADILTASGKRMTDLPTEGAGGWKNAVLGSKTHGTVGGIKGR